MPTAGMGPRPIAMLISCALLTETGRRRCAPPKKRKMGLYASWTVIVFLVVQGGGGIMRHDAALRQSTVI